MLSEFRHEKDNYQLDILQSLLHNFLLFAERERRKQNFVRAWNNTWGAGQAGHLSEIRQNTQGIRRR